MTQRADKLRDESPGRLSRGRYTSEEWEVWDSKDGTATGEYNLDGIVDPQQVETVAGLPQYGQAHTILTGALVTDVRVVQVHANWSYKVLVTYRGWGLYTGGPRAVTSFSGGAIEWDVPVFQLQQVAVGVNWYVRRQFTWQRENVLRTETRFVPGNQVDAIQTAVSRSVGGWYRIPAATGDFYVLSGRTDAAYDGLSYTRVNYRFQTWAKFPGAGASDPVLKNTVAVPALGNLEDWQVSFPGNDPGVAPLITVVPVTAFASAGLSLPGFP